MKFATKMSLGTLVLLMLFLALSGMLTVQRSFADSLAAAEKRCSQQQLKEKYAIEKNVYTAALPSALPDGINPNDYDRFSYASIGSAVGTLASATAGEGALALYANSTMSLFSNLPQAVKKAEQLAAVQGKEDEYRLSRHNGITYMMLTQPLSLPNQDVTLLSVYDVSDVFASRDAQLQSLLWLMACMLMPAALLAWVMSRLLTRPLAKLQRASETIATGDYDGRTCIATGDEIGALSRSFDAMAQSVQSNVTALQKNVREQEDFVSAFTHEIKTPMTSMLGYASLLRSREQTPELQHQAVDYIYHETKRLSELSHKLMQLMGLASDTITLAPVRLGVVLAGVRKTLPRESEVSVTFAPCAKDMVVNGDKPLLDDLLRNLIINAQRACAQKGDVKVCCEREGDACVLTVSDTGCGIPGHEIGKITEPFYMVDKSRAHSDNGSGMGLALCSRIAALHGGTLEIKSEEGMGTQVSLVLPAMPVREEESNETEDF